MAMFSHPRARCHFLIFWLGFGIFCVLNGANSDEAQPESTANRESVNVKDAEGDTPLMSAIRQMDLAAVQALLKAGASPDQPNNSGLRPLQLAESLVREAPTPEDLQRLKQSYIEGGLSPEEAEKFLLRSNAEYRAHKSGREKTTEVAGKIKNLLLRKLTEYRDSLESSDLFRAVRENKVDAVKKLLLAMDASEDGLLNARGRDGQSPIIIALLNFNVEMCEVLLDAGADMSVRDDTERCALDYVRALDNLFQRHRRLRDAQQLENAIQSGKLAPDRADPQGVTLLMKAAAENNYYLCKVLIAHGAKRDARDHRGDLAYDYIGRDAGNPHVEAQLKALLQCK
jgi:ankyrin repeat protein